MVFYTSSGVRIQSLLLLLAVVLCVFQQSEATYGKEYVRRHGHGHILNSEFAHGYQHGYARGYENGLTNRWPPSCPIKPDFSTTETTLRSLIFLAETEKAAGVLGLNETFGLGSGLQYLEEQRCAVVKTANRRQDPDIVAIQAVATSANGTGETTKLANAIVLSFEPRCQCSLFTAAEKDREVNYWKGVLDDPDEVRYILDYNGEEEEEEEEEETDASLAASAINSTAVSTGRRLVQDGRIPVTSLVCAYCRPKKTCRRSGILRCQRHQSHH